MSEGKNIQPQNGKVSTADFYKALLGVKDEMGAMERRIMDKLNELPSNKIIEDIQNDHAELSDKFEKHREKDKVVEWLIGIGTIAVGVIGAIFGNRQI